MPHSNFTRVEDFCPKKLAAAFIDLATEWTTAKDDNGTFYEFIRENVELFPGLNTKDQSAMKHANGLCQEVFTMNEDEIAENYNA